MCLLIFFHLPIYSDRVVDLVFLESTGLLSDSLTGIDFASS